MRTNGTGEPFLRISVKNGTDDADYITRPLFNGSLTDIDLQTFVNKLKVQLLMPAIPPHHSLIRFTLSSPDQPYALTTRSAWCSACGNNSTRQCDVISALDRTAAALNASVASAHHHRWGGSVSPVGAGFIGMGVTLGVVLALLGVAATFGLISFGRPPTERRGTHDAASHGEVKGGTL